MPKIEYRKEITFDLDVNELQVYFGDTSKKTKKYTKAYRELKNKVILQ